MVPRALTFGLVAVLVVGIAAATAALLLQRQSPYRQSRIGGAFTMVDTGGRPVTDADLRGKPSALFFGYTSCPEVCPTTLTSLTNVLGRMGSSADRLNTIFVTVDPEQDTPDRLRDYLSSFDPHIRGLTGSQAQTDAMAEAYHVVHRRVPGRNGDYSIDHTATVFLLDDTGRIAGEINQGEDEDPIQRAIAKSADPRPAGRTRFVGRCGSVGPTALRDLIRRSGQQRRYRL